MPPTVSINLCCYNSEKYLDETLASIAAQTYKDWELVIVDDGSSDGTGRVVQRYMRHHLPIVYRYQENRGLGASRNEALKRSSGTFVAFIDHDDVWMPEKLERQIPCFESDPEVALVFSDVIKFNERGDQSLYYGERKPPSGQVFRELFGNNYLCMSSTVLRRNALEGLTEWFDPRFQHIEEAELFARIAYRRRVAYVDLPLVKNRIHRESSTYLRPERSPIEMEMMIRKFIETYPGFDVTYREEIAQLEYYIQYYFALQDWRQGEKTMVRRRLKPFLFKKYRTIIPFGLSFFPYRVYDSILGFYRRRIKRIPVA